MSYKRMRAGLVKHDLFKYILLVSFWSIYFPWKWQHGSDAYDKSEFGIKHLKLHGPPQFLREILDNSGTINRLLVF